MFCAPLVVGSICKVVGQGDKLFSITSKGYIMGDNILSFSVSPVDDLTKTFIFPLSDLRRVIIYD